MRKFMAGLLVCAACGVCGAEDAPQASGMERHRAFHDEAVKLNEAQCAEQKGEWAPPAEGKPAECMLPTTDAGKICRSNSQCTVACVSKVDPRYAKNRYVVAECLRTSRWDGCFFYVEGGQVVQAECN